MKRVLLLMFLSFGVFNANAQQRYADKTKEIVATLGVPFTINPCVDLEIYLPHLTAEITGKDSEYWLQVSDSMAFSIVPTIYATTGYAGSPYYPTAYTYTITPQKTGYYVLSNKFYTYDRVYSLGSPTIFYNITVVDISSINLGTNSLSLNINESHQFNPILVHPSTQTTLTWLSSNNSVATIDENGLLTTTGVGTTTITCTAHNGVSAQCEVTVNPVLVSSITLSETDAEMTVGSRLLLEATVAPENVTDGSLTWSSSNESVAFVNERGKVIAASPGFCIVRATANDGSGKSASCIIEVTEGNAIRGDVDGDGRVTIEDVVKLIDLILEKE